MNKKFVYEVGNNKTVSYVFSSKMKICWIR